MIYRSRVWAENCNRLDLTSYPSSQLHKNYFVCDNHFESEMFKKCQQKRLHSTAYPSVLEPVVLHGVVDCRTEVVGANSDLNDTAVYFSDNATCSSVTDIIHPEINSNISEIISEPDITSTPIRSIVYKTSTPISGSTTRKRTYWDSTTQVTPSHNSGIKRKRDATVQVARSFSSHTPRKLLLQRKLKSLRQAALRRSKRQSVKTSKAQMQVDFNTLSEISMRYLSPHLHSFFMSQLTLSQVSNKRGRRYTVDNKMFALSLYYKSPAAYKLLSNTFQLPSISMLSKWLRKNQSDTGFDTSLIDALKLKVENMTVRDKTCALLIDEMSIKSNLYYNSASDKIIGFEDTGDDDRTRTIASSVLVFMVSGLASRWKQPLGFFFVGTSCSAVKVRNLLYKCLTKTTSIGLNVTAVVSDQGSNFYMLCNLLSVSVDKPFFEYNGKPYFYLFDPPHLLKSIRNNLQKHVFEFGDKQQALWAHICQLYDIDSAQHYRLAPRLTKQHVDLPAFTSMRVKLASQVFSYSVSAAIHTHSDADPPTLPPEASDTAEFCNILNNLFDSVNSLHFTSKNKYQCAISNTSCHIEYYQYMIDWFSSLKVINSSGKVITSKIKCIKGWMITLSAISKLWKNLSELCEFSFLISRRLNQDNLENFFGAIRQKGGKCDNPTPFMFGKQFSHVCTSNLITSMPSSNCQQDSDSFLVLLGDASKKIISEADVSLVPPQPHSSESSKLNREVKSASDEIIVHTTSKTKSKQIVQSRTKAEANALFYVLGVLLKKLDSVHKCSTCSSLLHSKTKQITTDKQRFTSYKAYAASASNRFGNLHVGSELFYKYIVECEELFIEQFALTAHHKNVATNIVHQLKSVSLPGVCKGFPLDLMLNYFCKLRINYVLKFSNREFASSKKKMRKLFKIQSL